jgi:hypothetical protein
VPECSKLLQPVLRRRCIFLAAIWPEVEEYCSGHSLSREGVIRFRLHPVQMVRSIVLESEEYCSCVQPA